MYVLLKSKVYQRLPTAADTGEDRFPLQYSAEEVKFPPSAMGEEQLPSQKGNDKDRVPPEDTDDERNQLLNKNGEGRVPPNKKQVENRKMRRKPFGKVCPFEETDSITLCTKKK